MEETYTMNDILTALPWETMFKTAKAKKEGCEPKEEYTFFWDGYSTGVLGTWNSINENVLSSTGELDIDAGVIAGFQTLVSYLQEFEQALGVMVAGDDPTNMYTNHWDGAIAGAVEVMQMAFKLRPEKTETETIQ